MKYRNEEDNGNFLASFEIVHWVQIIHGQKREQFFLNRRVYLGKDAMWLHLAC